MKRWVGKEKKIKLKDINMKLHKTGLGCSLIAKTKKCYVLVFILVLGLVTFNCASNTSTIKKSSKSGILPLWIHSRESTTYPKSRFMIGMGMASDSGDPVRDYKQSDFSAFSDILNQIKASVSSTVSTNRVELLSNQTSEYLNKTTANIVVASSVTVSGLTIVQRYYDKDNKLYYSLAVLDRRAASNQFKNRLLGNKNEYDRNITKAEEFYKQGRIADALLALRQAFNSARLYNADYPYYQIIKGSEYVSIEDLPNYLSAGDATSKASDILAGLKLVKVTGDNQAGLIGRPLAIPLTVKVIIKNETETPASGLAIGFQFVNGTGEMESSARTDDNGEAKININKLGKSDTRTYSVSAMPDFNEFIDPADIYKQWDTIFDTNSSKVLFQITLKKASIPWKILLLVDEPAGFTAIDTLSTELTQVGFSPLTEKDIGIIKGRRIEKLIGQNKFNLLKQEFMHEYDVIVTGRINAEFLSNYAGINVFTASGGIKAISLKTGKVIAEESVSDVKGFGITNDQAKNDVIQKAMEKMTDSLVSQLLKNNQLKIKEN